MNQDNNNNNDLNNNKELMTLTSDSDQSTSENNGITATQLVEEKVYSDGSIEKEYVVNNMALQNMTTGAVYTYASSYLPRNTTQYNICAMQTAYFTCKYSETGVAGVYNDAWIHCTKEQSSVNFTTTRVAAITHGIIASLLSYPTQDDRVVNGVPANNQVYTVLSLNNAYYRDNTTGSYFTFLNVLTQDGKSFELDIDLLSILDGGY